MVRSVHLTPQVTRQIKLLRRSGGEAALAAEHAQAIICKMIEGVSSIRELGRFTKHGDARISRCIKFDLVRGYRLIGVIGYKEISLVFFGSHDKCDHWLKNNAGLESVPNGRKAEVFEAGAEQDEKEAAPIPEEAFGMDTDEYEPALLHDLTDSDLRKIFCGICSKQT